MPLGTEPESRITQPLQGHRGWLHRYFAQTEPTGESILTFANCHGPLGGDIEALIPLERTEGKKRFLGSGEQLNKWIHEIVILRDAILLWDFARKEDTDGLANHVEWLDDDRGVGVRWEDEWGGRSRLIAGKSVQPETYERFTPGNLIEPALIAVQQIVNDNLWRKKRAAPKLIWHVKRKVLQQHVVPDGLIGAIWLDFSLAINGKQEYRRCTRCGTVFPVPSKGQIKRFCSNKCRTAHHRQMHSQGGQE